MCAPTQCFCLIQPCNDSLCLYCVRASTLACSRGVRRSRCACALSCVYMYMYACASGFSSHSTESRNLTICPPADFCKCSKGAQPSNFIFGRRALRLNRCHSRLPHCSSGFKRWRKTHSRAKRRLNDTDRWKCWFQNCLHDCISLYRWYLSSFMVYYKSDQHHHLHQLPRKRPRMSKDFLEAKSSSFSSISQVIRMGSLYRYVPLMESKIVNLKPFPYMYTRTKQDYLSLECSTVTDADSWWMLVLVTAWKSWCPTSKR